MADDRYTNKHETADVRRRLRRVFDDFQRQGGIARMAFKDSHPTALNAIRELCKERHCFKYVMWSGGDADKRFRQGHHVRLYYGGFEPYWTRWVGHELDILLRFHGVITEWDGSPHTTIGCVGTA